MTPLAPWADWHREVARAIASVPDETLERVARAILGAKLVVTAGNGGSAAIASHAAQAVCKPDYNPGGGRAAVCLTDGVPVLTAHANDGGWQSALAEAGRPLLANVEGSILLVVSSSGRSENVVRLAQLARDLGRDVVALTGFAGEPLRSLATVSVHVDSSDYEVVEPVHDALVHRAQAHIRALGRQVVGSPR